MDFTDKDVGDDIKFYIRDLRKFYKRVLSDGSKTAVVIHSEVFQKLFVEAKGQNDYTSLEETVITDHAAFFLPRKSFMVEPFNRKVMQLVEAGIAEKIVKSYDKHFGVEEPDDHIVLTLGHLGFGFYIWLGCLGIASAFFLLEKLFDKFLSIAYKFIMRKLKAKIKRNLFVCRSVYTNNSDFH